MPRIQYITVHIKLEAAKKLVQPAWGSAPERKAGDPTAPESPGTESCGVLAAASAWFNDRVYIFPAFYSRRICRCFDVKTGSTD